jgi:hypothetical protein
MTSTEFDYSCRRMQRQPFLALAPFEEGHPPALAIYCSDGRFTNAVEELLHHLGHPRLDTITIAGGPALFNVWLAGMSDSMAVGTCARFLMESHGTRQVILIAHEGCGYYRKHYKGLRPEQIQAHQLDDLRHADRTLRQAHEHVEVLLYMASVENGRTLFTPVHPG